MVHIRSLLWLLFLLNALKHCSLAHQVDKSVLEFDNDAIDTSATRKDVVDGMKAGIRGRKMMVEEVKGEKEIEKIGISGKEENGGIEKSLQGQHWKHHQEHMKKLKVETDSSAILGTPKKSSNYNNSEQDSNKAEEEENQKLLDDTKQMVSLMNKDYTGFKKAKRKPPINNSLPFP